MTLFVSLTVAAAEDGAPAAPATPGGQVCVERLTRDGFATRLEEAEGAWLDLDTARFRDRMNVLTGLVVPCLGDLVPPDLSARWHRVMALHLDGLGDDAGSDAALQRARALDPALPFDDAWVGADHHLRAAIAAPPEAEARKVPEPRAGSLAFDGTLTRERPVDEPTLLQWFDGSGVARTTAYLGPDDPLPAYDAVPRLRNTLLGSGAASLLASGVAIGLAYGSQAELFRLSEDPSLGADPLVAQRRRTDLLAGAGYGLLGIGVGFGAAAVAVGQR
jgi:hypothetical protein